MNWVPYQRLVIHSPFAPSEFVARLQAEVEPLRLFRNPLSRNHKPYEGGVAGDRFEIERIIQYRNSFVPLVQGQVLAGSSGSRIEVTLRLRWLIVVFMGIWFGGLAIGWLALMSRVILGRGAGLSIVAVSVMLGFGYLLLVGRFTVETRKAARFLEELAGVNKKPG
jgi:hypothetical protein